MTLSWDISFGITEGVDYHFSAITAWTLWPEAVLGIYLCFKKVRLKIICIWYEYLL